MSRRSLVPRPDVQLRAGRRLTMGPVRQFSEAPVRSGAGPQRLFALEPETASPPAFGPTHTRWMGGGLEYNGSPAPSGIKSVAQINALIGHPEYNGSEEFIAYVQGVNLHFEPLPPWQVLVEGVDPTTKAYAGVWLCPGPLPSDSQATITPGAGVIFGQNWEATIHVRAFRGQSGGRWRATGSWMTAAGDLVIPPHPAPMWAAFHQVWLTNMLYWLPPGPGGYIDSHDNVEAWPGVYTEPQIFYMGQHRNPGKAEQPFSALATGNLGWRDPSLLTAGGSFPIAKATGGAYGPPGSLFALVGYEVAS